VKKKKKKISTNEISPNKTCNDECGKKKLKFIDNNEKF
jgi:hypothetical protein